ncbi:protein kinase [Actinoplanes sp. NPDC051859]|uniref:serine/threonine-protein kinase n=1 Tax=Actinoplanes sp. NPDC051859 TaxID=3363909 RepID=UPI0037B23B2B
MPSSPVSSAASGSVLVGGRYRLTERIGSGGMGVVWRAQDELLRRPVAVKELRHSWGSSDRTVAEGRERSLREARAAAALRHPNIVNVYDIAQHDEQPWIVMELVSGRSLKEIVLNDGPLPVERAVEMGLQLVSALHAAHTAGITHRDVKPANVLVAENGSVWLTDFGLATMQDAETLTETGAILGTPGYLAPEQAKGLVPGPPADVFGLGATLYFAIQGAGPFQREAYLASLVAYTRHEIRTPDRAGALAPVLLRLLAEDPAKRPTLEQAREMLVDGIERRRRPTRRQLLTAGAAAAVVAAGSGTGWWYTHRPPAPTPVDAPPSPVGPVAWQRDDLRFPILVGYAVLGLGGGAVRSVDAVTGAVRWSTAAPKVESLRDLGNNLVLGESRGSGGLIFDVVSGRRQAAPKGVVLAASRGLMLTERGGLLTALDAAKGDVLWQTPGSYGSTFAFAASGLIFAVRQTRAGFVAVEALDHFTGAEGWSTVLDTTGQIVGLWESGERLYAVVNEPGRRIMCCLKAANGTLSWQMTLATFRVDRPEQFIDVVDVVATVDGLVLTSLESDKGNRDRAGLIAVSDGDVLWHRPLPSAAVTIDSVGMIYATSYDSELHRIQPKTGYSTWSVPTPASFTRLHVVREKIIGSVGGRVTAYPLTGD